MVQFQGQVSFLKEFEKADCLASSGDVLGCPLLSFDDRLDGLSAQD